MSLTAMLETHPGTVLDVELVAFSIEQRCELLLVKDDLRVERLSGLQDRH
jgi:hypothetical protein